MAFIAGLTLLLNTLGPLFDSIPVIIDKYIVAADAFGKLGVYGTPSTPGMRASAPEQTTPEAIAETAHKESRDGCKHYTFTDYSTYPPKSVKVNDC